MPDEMSEVEENIRILVEAALEVQHRLDGHDQPIEDCAPCRAFSSDPVGGATKVASRSLRPCSPTGSRDATRSCHPRR